MAFGVHRHRSPSRLNGCGGAYADGQMYCFALHRAFAAIAYPRRADELDRMDQPERSASPGSHFVDGSIGDRRSEVGENVETVWIAHTGLSIPGAYRTL